MCPKYFSSFCTVVKISWSRNETTSDSIKVRSAWANAQVEIKINFIPPANYHYVIFEDYTPTLRAKVGCFGKKYFPNRVPGQFISIYTEDMNNLFRNTSNIFEINFFLRFNRINFKKDKWRFRRYKNHQVKKALSAQHIMSSAVGDIESFETA